VASIKECRSRGDGLAGFSSPGGMASAESVRGHLRIGPWHDD